MLSSFPRKDIFCDDNSIYYLGGPTAIPYQVPTLKEDIIREDIILQILDAGATTLDFYQETNGHIRTASFHFCFTGRKESVYYDYIRNISEEMSLVRDYENCQLPTRLGRHRVHLTQLITTLKQEKAPLPAIAKTLEERLSPHGYHELGR